MSTYIWGKIKLKEIPEKLENYQSEDILIYFDKQKKSSLFLSELNEREVYFNIACGYEEMIPQHARYCLNCDELFFSLNFPKRAKDLELYYYDLHERIKRLQKFIIELYNNPNVEKITYYYTESGNEVSIDEYEKVDWKINEFAEHFFDEIIKLRGLTPTIQIVWTKQNNGDNI